MRIQCAWCQLDLGRKAPFDEHGISHGMCKDCMLREIEEILSNTNNRTEVEIFKELVSIGIN